MPRHPPCALFSLTSFPLQADASFSSLSSLPGMSAFLKALKMHGLFSSHLQSFLHIPSVVCFRFFSLLSFGLQSPAPLSKLSFRLLGCLVCILFANFDTFRSFRYSVFKVQFRAFSFSLRPVGSAFRSLSVTSLRTYGLKWTRTTDLTLIRRAL